MHAHCMIVDSTMLVSLWYISSSKCSDICLKNMNLSVYKHVFICGIPHIAKPSVLLQPNVTNNCHIESATLT